ANPKPPTRQERRFMSRRTAFTRSPPMPARLNRPRSSLTSFAITIRRSALMSLKTFARRSHQDEPDSRHLGGHNGSHPRAVAGDQLGASSNSLRARCVGHSVSFRGSFAFRIMGLDV